MILKVSVFLSYFCVSVGYFSSHREHGDAQSLGLYSLRMKIASRDREAILNRPLRN